MNAPQDTSGAEVTTLDGLFRSRVARTPEAVAYRQFDAGEQLWRAWRWEEVAAEAARWCGAFRRDGLHPGDRVAVMLPNCVEWVIFDQAALAAGLVTVPLFHADNAQNCAHVLRDAGARVVVAGGANAIGKLSGVLDELPALERIVRVDADERPDEGGRIIALHDWLAHDGGEQVAPNHAGDDLATIVYTSGTTGAPKGVMLTHANILKNTQAAARVADVGGDDVMVSFLPLSHMFERTAGCYLSILVGAETAFARSAATLMEDIAAFKPTVLISVPRIYEQVLGRIEAKMRGSPVRAALYRLTVAVGRRRGHNFLCRTAWPVLDRAIAAKVRAVFGGHVRYAISGGAPMPPAMTRTLLALGLPVFQGYGLTEASPVISVNTPDDNVPESIGFPLREIEVTIGDNDELLTRGDCVMRGYWNLPDATRAAIDGDGWLHTGDQVRRDADGRLYITGRIKEIIVMASGEKVPPADVEQALLTDPLISQVMVYGEGRPFLVACVVADPEQLDATGDLKAAAAALRKRSMKLLARFPAHARIRRFIFVEQPWSVDDGTLTPTLKIKRAVVVERVREQIEAAYRGFE